MMRVNLRATGGPTQRGTVASALAELGARIWEELERLAQLAELEDTPTPALAAATLRLELLIVLDACDSLAWRARLTALERATLRAMALDVLHTIAVSAEALTRAVLEQAQDRVFDHVLELSIHAEAERDAAAGLEVRHLGADCAA